MGGMFSLLKVRKDLAPGDYKDPGWYQHPPGGQAYEYTGELPKASSHQDAGEGLMPLNKQTSETYEFTAIKPKKHQS